MSVCQSALLPSHAGFVSKRSKLGSRIFARYISFRNYKKAKVSALNVLLDHVNRQHSYAYKLVVI